MAHVESIIVGGGIQAGAPFTVNTLLYVTSVTPPQAASANARVAPATNPPQVFIGENGGVSTAANGTYIGDCTFGTNTAGQINVIIGSAQAYANFSAPATGVIMVGVGNTMAVGTGGNHQGNIVIGFTNTFNANADNASFAIVIGDTNAITADMNAGRIVGRNNQVSFNAPVLMYGDSNQVTGNTGGALMFGYSHTNAGNQGVAIHIGSGCLCSAGTGMFRPILIGTSLNITAAATGATDVVMIGNSNIVSGASAAHSLLLTSQVTVSGTSQGIIRLGNGVNAQTFNNRVGYIGIGIGVLADPGNGWVVIGHNPATVTASGRTSNLLLGGTDTDATATGFGIRFTNASGTNVAAGNAVITAPLSTGSGATARIDLQTGLTPGAGTGQHVARTSLAVQASATAGQTDLLLFDVDNNTLERVTVGAADSGGVGFKLLRIPN